MLYIYPGEEPTYRFFLFEGSVGSPTILAALLAQYSKEKDKTKYSAVHLIQTPGGPTKFVLIMRCSNYEFALNIKCKNNGLSGDHNHVSELTSFLN